MADLIPEERLNELHNELVTSARPVYFFDDDPDGLCSFLICYKTIKEGHGIIVKANPGLSTVLADKAKSYSPDKIFILDKAVIDQDFINELNRIPTVIVDHHKVLDLKHVNYFNPRKYDPSKQKPTTHWCYKAARNEDLLWLYAIGCIGDWFIPDNFDEIMKKYPDLVDAEFNDPGDVMFETKLGKLVKIFAFLLKGRTSDVKKAIKILTRIKSPYEILNQETAQGRFIYKRFAKLNDIYEEVLANAKASVKEDDVMLVFNYNSTTTSFTPELSNELLHMYPDKVTIIAREKDDKIRMSLRSGKHKIEPILQEVLKEVNGFGGGHEYACGAGIEKADFERFVERFRELVNESK